MLNRVCIVLIAVVSASLFAAAYEGVAQEEPAGIQKRIIELKIKRRDTLKQRVEALQKKRNEGGIEITAAIRAREDLYLAELELVSEKTKRVDLSRQRLENLVNLESVFAARYKNGIGPFEDKLVATAARLQAEIDLLREQAAGK